MSKFAIGVDFGTLSARALIAEIGTGREVGEAELAYPHGVMTETLPNGTPLPPDWALQHPGDYLLALETTVARAMARSGVAKEDVVGLGIDFTASTVLPVDAEGRPMSEKYPDRPHAYVKLWKHHAAQTQADAMTRLARERNEPWLGRYGGKVSSEWMLPKIWQTLAEDETLYQESAYFIEAGDWLVWNLTGNLVRSAGIAGYKALWNIQDGYPSREYLAACAPKMREVTREKLGPVKPLGFSAGGLRAKMAEKLSLLPGTPVAVANIDAHVSVPGAGMTEEGSLLMIMGTSNCHILLSGQESEVPGICGAVEDGAIPGLIAYEAGQSCVGDQFRWFAERCVPADYKMAAQARGLDIQQYLTELTRALAPGQSGLMALDWWNGNRSVLVDAELSGMILGLTLETRPEEIYRALIEATAYGTRVIVDQFEAAGLNIRNLYACGGIAQKNPFLMQLYADVLRREIRVARSSQAPALGSAMFAAVAAGAGRGGYDTIGEAARAMAGQPQTVYRPQPRASAVYDKLFAEYRRLHDYFGRGVSNVMKRLKRIQRNVK